MFNVIHRDEKDEIANRKYKAFRPIFMDKDGHCLYNALLGFLHFYMKKEASIHRDCITIESLFGHRFSGRVIPILETIHFGGYENMPRLELVRLFRDFIRDIGIEQIPESSNADFLSEIRGYGGSIVITIFINIFRIKSVTIYLVKDGIANTRYVMKYEGEPIIKKNLSLRLDLNENHYDILVPSRR